MNEIQQAFESINFLIIAPILLLQLILMIIALVDLIKIDQTKGPKALWAVLILVTGIIGPILYLIIGRRQ
ncbi:PLD nuclease N-terminal domain-containing protein [Peribacillus alkalitolerans]|uniref:PLD nuclease N-terminal domain-containing protein n=1 Tax=Peribacillus alkalitolerans TaxID=1550385 RepID=UPI0013CFB664|nr:PLD nuclease N-terminal domain-containing protein [Peribacillus alkalitolerans]